MEEWLSGGRPSSIRCHAMVDVYNTSNEEKKAPNYSGRWLNYQSKQIWKTGRYDFFAVLYGFLLPTKRKGAGGRYWERRQMVKPNLSRSCEFCQYIAPTSEASKHRVVETGEGQGLAVLYSALVYGFRWPQHRSTGCSQRRTAIKQDVMYTKNCTYDMQHPFYFWSDNMMIIPNCMALYGVNGTSEPEAFVPILDIFELRTWDPKIGIWWFYSCFSSLSFGSSILRSIILSICSSRLDFQVLSLEHSTIEGRVYFDVLFTSNIYILEPDSTQFKYKSSHVKFKFKLKIKL